MKSAIKRTACTFLLSSLILSSFVSCLGESDSQETDTALSTVQSDAQKDSETPSGTDTEDKPGGEEPALTREDMINGLKGLNVLCIGDSLFDGDAVGNEGQWLGLLAKECQWNFTNLGRNGWTVAYDPAINQSGTTKKQSMYQKLYNDPNYTWGTNDSQYYKCGNTNTSKETVDIVLLEGGVNDYSLGYPLGTASSKDPSEVLGAWNLIVEKMLVDYPNAKIVFFTSWHVEQKRDDGARRMDFVVNGVRDIVENNYYKNDRVIFLDAGASELSGIYLADAAFREEYAMKPSDTNHLNEKGMRLMAEAMIPVLWELTQE